MLRKWLVSVAVGFLCAGNPHFAAASETPACNKTASDTSELEGRSRKLFPWMSQEAERQAWIARAIERREEARTMERIAQIQSGMSVSTKSACQ